MLRDVSRVRKQDCYHGRNTGILHYVQDDPGKRRRPKESVLMRRSLGSFGFAQGHDVPVMTQPRRTATDTGAFREHDAQSARRPPSKDAEAQGS